MRKGMGETVKLEANVPSPLYEGLKLIHDTFGFSWDELIEDSVRGYLQASLSDNMENETKPLRDKISSLIEKSWES
jgi:hypothetical protein